MIWTKVKRVVRAGFVNFWRNAFVSLSSVLIMVVTLFTIGSVVFLGAILNSSLEGIKDKVDINVFFVTTAPESEILALRDKVEKLQEVRSVEYVSRDEALERFIKANSDKPSTLQSLEELDENPLGANLNIKAVTPSQYEGIAEFLNGENALTSDGQTIIDDVTYGRNKIVIERLTKIIDSADRIGFGISLLLIVLSIIITFNTIRLAIYTARDEISVMRLVGASHRYIRGPFVISGILYGLISGFLTLLIYYPATYWFRNVSEDFLANFSLFEYYIAHFGELFLLIVGSGVLIGALSSYFAVRRYLKL